MRHASSQSKTTRRTENAPARDSSTGREAISMAPPEYGIDFVDQGSAVVQRQENKTGLPDTVKAGIENTSGLSMDDVRVHYNSSKPKQFHAAAYTQGTNIYLGRGQERHLDHEAWHVVQQKQRRVQPTLSVRGVAVNLNPRLEREADVMGKRARRAGHLPPRPERTAAAPNTSAVQLKPKPLVNAPHMDPAGTWDPTIDAQGRVTKIKASNLKLQSGQALPGSGANSPSVAPVGWTWLQGNSLTHPSGPPNYVRMHMLNGQLGGPGNDKENLAPGTASLNTNHEKHFESEAKDWLNRGGVLDEYVVEVKYNSASASLKTAQGKSQWCNTIKSIEGRFDYEEIKGKKRAKHQATFKAEEDPGLDTKANWAGF